MLWRLTDWTAWQRVRAIRGLLLAAAGFGLMAGCLAQWRTLTLAATLIAPIGMTLLYLGIAHLNAVYWYPFQHAVNSDGERARRASIMAGTMKIETWVALVTLALQVVGAPLLALSDGAIFGVTSFAFANLVIAPLIASIVANGGNFVAIGSLFPWRPRRDPTVAETAVRSARGLRRPLRAITMGLAANSLFLVIPPPFIFSDAYDQLAFGSAPYWAPMSEIVTGFALAAALLLILALSELTNRRQADAPTAPEAHWRV